MSWPVRPGSRPPVARRRRGLPAYRLRKRSAPSGGDKAAAGSGITQEEADIKLRVDIPEIQPFLQASGEGPVVPDLKQNAVPQGMAYLAERSWILLSHYREDGKPSLLTVVDASTGKMVKALELYRSGFSPIPGMPAALRSAPSIFGFRRIKTYIMSGSRTSSRRRTAASWFSRGPSQAGPGHRSRLTRTACCGSGNSPTGRITRRINPTT
ncbi:hypothetical protein LJK88_18130 [Paenibacillus sp. P26]|nr:hypothetical protein LJK88_18130 [Paenibacillus sp. P26]